MNITPHMTAERAAQMAALPLAVSCNAFRITSSPLNPFAACERVSVVF